MIGLLAIIALVSALPAYALGDNEKDVLKILAGSALIYSAIKDDQNHTRIDLHSYRGSHDNRHNNRHNNRHYESAYDNYGYRSVSRRHRESSCMWTTLNTKIYDRYGHLQEVRRTKVCR